MFALFPQKVGVPRAFPGHPSNYGPDIAVSRYLLLCFTYLVLLKVFLPFEYVVESVIKKRDSF